MSPRIESIRRCRPSIDRCRSGVRGSIDSASISRSSTAIGSSNSRVSGGMGRLPRSAVRRGRAASCPGSTAPWPHTRSTSATRLSDGRTRNWLCTSTCTRIGRSGGRISMSSATQRSPLCCDSTSHSRSTVARSCGGVDHGDRHRRAPAARVSDLDRRDLGGQDARASRRRAPACPSPPPCGRSPPGGPTA